MADIALKDLDLSITECGWTGLRDQEIQTRFNRIGEDAHTVLKAFLNVKSPWLTQAVAVRKNAVIINVEHYNDKQRITLRAIVPSMMEYHFAVEHTVRQLIKDLLSKSGELDAAARRSASKEISSYWGATAAVIRGEMIKHLEMLGIYGARVHHVIFQAERVEAEYTVYLLDGSSFSLTVPLNDEEPSEPFSIPQGLVGNSHGIARLRAVLPVNAIFTYFEKTIHGHSCEACALYNENDASLGAWPAWIRTLQTDGGMSPIFAASSDK